ncbi:MULTISPECIES: thioredoxin domain-containing protein [unclassified Streptomyces]|uniref:thioredoxin domain-containing protein n=1 Tax=unclassified Streptomyces TaxID=2593676 RepID=UPI003800C6DE
MRHAARVCARVAAGAAAAGLLTLSLSACGLLTTDSGGSPASSASPADAASQASAAGVPTAPDPKVLAGLPARMEADGTTITVGDPAAPKTVHIYEDPRCPVCQAFEKAAGPQLAALAADGRIKLQYTLASFLDEKLGGEGSRRAGNALRASVDAGKGAFATYHETLYAHQPDESEDGFTDAYLLELAGGVDGLRGAAFDQAVGKWAHKDFVTASEDAFIKSGATGTPYVKIDGEAVPQEDLQKLFDPASFAALLRQAGIGG